MEKEKVSSTSSGYICILVFIVFLGLGISGLVYYNQYVPGIVFSMFCFAGAIFTALGLMVVNPNESSVLVLFGEYKGTIKSNGFFWVNPFYVKKKISLRARNLNREPIKVNDKLGAFFDSLANPSWPLK